MTQEILEKALELCEEAFVSALEGGEIGIAYEAKTSSLGIHEYFIAEAKKRLKKTEEPVKSEKRVKKFSLPYCHCTRNCEDCSEELIPCENCCELFED